VRAACDDISMRSLAGLVVLSAFLLPVFSSADTVSDLEALIQLAQLQIQAVQTQSAGAVSAPAGAVLGASTVCPNLTRNLSLGSRGTDVQQLQQFLISQKLLAPDSATGYFGKLTQVAVQKWQCKNMNICSGSPSSNGWGSVGSRTRAVMANCSLPTTANQSALQSAYAQSSYGGDGYAQANYYAQGSYVPAPSPAPSPTPTPSPTPPPPPAQTWASRIDAARPFSNGFPVQRFGCNSDSFGSIPELGNLFIGRIDNTDATTCNNQRWSLVLARMDWNAHAMTNIGTVLDTSHGLITLSDGFNIWSAYDASVAKWNGELWVAFECGGPQGFGTAASCVGPLTSNLKLDTTRTVVVVNGGSAVPGDATLYSASVPELLAYQGHLYLYWTAVHLTQTTWLDITGRGIELTQEPGGLRRLWAKKSSGMPAGSAIFPNDPSVTEVFGLDPSDSRSNSAADIQDVVTDGTSIFFTGGRGGSGCLTPLGTQPGCYRLTIGKTSTPLGYHAFNHELIPDSVLPPNPQEYYRFVYRPDTKGTWLLGGNLINPANLQNVMTGMWAFPWPENIFSEPAQIVSTPTPTPAPTMADERKAFVGTLYSCILGRAADAGGLANWSSLPTGTTLRSIFAGFFNSAEYSAKATTDQTYVNHMYLCVLDRIGDTGGIATWLGALQNGASRAAILDDFIASAEFQSGHGATLEAQTGWTKSF